MKNICSLRKKRIFCALLVAVLLAFSCVTAAVASPKGKVVIAVGTNFPTMDPHMHLDRVAWFASWSFYDNLVYRNPKTMEIEPNLASSWKIVDDRTWIFELRRDAKFHNGKPFKAECVKFSIERVLDPKQNSPQRTNVNTISQIDVIDDYTLRIVTANPDPVLLQRLACLSIVDPDYVKSLSSEEFAKKPMGTGPYKFVEWLKGQRLVMEANEKYWKEIPQVKTVVWRPIPEMATQIAELLSGGVDMIRGIPPDQVPIIEKSKVAWVSKAPVLRTNFLYFDSMGRGGPSPAQNKKFRQAVNCAVNVDGIIQHILGGMAVRTPAGLNPMSFGFDKNVKAHPYDPQKAKALLAEAGYPNGVKFSLFSYGGSVMSVHQVVEAIAGDLAKIGIEVNNRYFEDVGLFRESVNAGKVKDSYLMSSGSVNIFDADMMYYPMILNKGWRYMDDPKVDSMLEEGRSSLDAEKRKKIYSEFQRYFVEEAYWLPLYAQHIILGVSNRINYEAASDEMIRAFDITWK